MSWLEPELEAIAQAEVADSVFDIQITNKAVKAYCDKHGFQFLPVLQKVRERISELLAEKRNLNAITYVFVNDGNWLPPEKIKPERRGRKKKRN